ncbi:ADP-ribosylglycohydrolase family protein [Actinophytocola sp. KF-1]
MLVELAVGDAYGAAFEYAPAAMVAEHNTVTDYCRHPTHTGIAPGDYTDDTQMTLALAELLVDGAEWTPPVIAAKFVEVFHRDPRVGYASRFQGFLRATRTGAEFLATIRPDSDKSGAAMRVTPVGLLPSVDEVREYAAVQARITHDTPAGVAAAEAAALAVHYCHHELGPLRDVAGWVSDRTGVDWTRPWSGKVGPKGEMAVRAALTALAAATSMRELLRACVAFTGDVDTVATIALAAGSRSPEVADDLPMALFRNLERGPYGFPYLYDLDRRLLSAMSPPVTDPAALLGTWSDDALYLGAMAAESVTFEADGTGHHLWENAAAQEKTPFRWALTAPGEVRVDDEVRTARIGPGTTATGDRITVLTLGGTRYGRCLPVTTAPATGTA